MENLPPETSVKPRYFEVIGWSWFIFGWLGLALGLLGLLGLPALNQTQQSLNNYPMVRFLPGFQDTMALLFRIFLPLTLVQIGVSLVMCWGAWKFIKGKAWGRWILIIINYFFIILTGASYFLAIQLARRLIMTYIDQGVDLGTPLTLPSYFNLPLVLITVLMIIPMALMAWYLHWKPVRDYFGQN